MRHRRHGHDLRLLGTETSSLHPLSANPDSRVDGAKPSISSGLIGRRPIGRNFRCPRGNRSAHSASEPPSAGESRRRFTNECASACDNGGPQ